MHDPFARPARGLPLSHTDCSTAAIEQSRNAMSLAFPNYRVGPNVPGEFGSDFANTMRGWQQLANVIIIASLALTGCGLAVSVVTGRNMSVEALREWIGTRAPFRAVPIQQAYPVAFFDLHLRHRRQRLLEGPSPAFSEVRYVP